MDHRPETTSSDSRLHFLWSTIGIYFSKFEYICQAPVRDADGFVTPGRAAPRPRRSSRRLPQFAGLLDELRPHDLRFRRGSTSEKRREAARRRRAEEGEGERPDAKAAASSTPDWRAELVEGVPQDESSPVHKELR